MGRDVMRGWKESKRTEYHKQHVGGGNRQMLQLTPLENSASHFLRYTASSQATQAAQQLIRVQWYSQMY